MPLWPTLFCVNLWLTALGVPLLLAAANRTASTFVFLAAPLALLCYAVGLRFRRNRYGQAALLIGVPLLAMLPAADGGLADPHLQPRPAVLLQVLMLLGYLAAVCQMLATDFARPLVENTISSSSQSKAPLPWQVTTLPVKTDSQRLSRRVLMHRLLLAYTLILPSLFIYAIDLDPANLRALRAAFGSVRRVSAMQSSLTAGVAVLTSVLFYFCIMAPLSSYLDHHRELRGDLQSMRRRARRGRPRASLYVYMMLALSSMVLLILWSLRQ